MTGSYSDTNLRVVYPHDINDSIRDVLRRDATAYWKMDEWNGTRRDSTGRGNHFSQSFGVTNGVSGKVATGAFFEESTNSMSAVGSADLKTGNISFYISFWIKLLSNHGSASLVLSKINPDFEFSVETNGSPLPNRKMTFWTLGGGVENSQIISSNQFYFVEVYQDNINIRIGIAINNGAFTTVGYGLSPAATNSPVEIQKDLVTSDHFVIDEILFMRRLPTNYERDYLWNSGNGVSLFP